MCLLSDAEQVVHSVLLELFHWQELPAAAAAGNKSGEGSETEPQQ